MAQLLFKFKYYYNYTIEKTIAEIYLPIKQLKQHNYIHTVTKW